MIFALNLLFPLNLAAKLRYFFHFSNKSINFAIKIFAK